MSARPPYPECRVPYVRPTPGVRTWQSSAGDAGYVHAGCTGDADCVCACAVGVYNVNGRVYGCGCHGHDGRRARLLGGR